MILKPSPFTKPTRPVALGLGLSGDTITLTWIPNSNSTIGYNIYRTTDPSKQYKKVAFVKYKDARNRLINTITDKPGSTGTVYYMVKAVNGLIGRSTQQVESAGVTARISIL